MKRGSVKREKRGKNNEFWIYGVHPIREALMKKRDTISRILLKRGSHTDIENMAQDIPLEYIRDDYVPFALPKDAVHQGVFALLSRETLSVPYKTFLSTLKVEKNTSLILLDEITDPHNVGALIRVASAFGVSGVLLPSHRQAPLTGAVVKASSGTLFSLPLVSIPNVNTVLRDLQKKGFWLYALDSKGPFSLKDEDFSRPSVFVFGSEGFGVREKTRELCDTVLSIPMEKRCESLNVSSSASVVLFSWYTRK
jgi:23S rRNA (guanosine2251-2'-O)-methyltransferase